MPSEANVFVLKDREIRTSLVAALNQSQSGQADYLLVEELGLCQGTARVDVAVINGYIHGYEIKSEKDDLSRLPLQMDVYRRTLDAVTVVTTSRHLEALQAQVPTWWGISLAEVSDEQVRLSDVRVARPNPELDPQSLVQLLWRDEALNALVKLGLAKGMLSKPREVIWKKLASSLELNQLRTLVLSNIKQRQNWRVG